MLQSLFSNAVDILVECCVNGGFSLVPSFYLFSVWKSDMHGFSVIVLWMWPGFVPSPYYKAFFNFIICFNKRKICSLFGDMSILRPPMLQNSFHLCVFWSLCSCVCMAHAYGGHSLWSLVSSVCLHNCLRNGISPNLVCNSSARLADQWALRIFLLLSPPPTPVPWLQTSIAWPYFSIWILGSESISIPV